MAITKIQKNALPDPLDLTSVDLQIGNDEIVTANIADNNVTHAKLHTDMDLSGKTVTLPDLNQTLIIDRSSSNGTPIADFYTNKGQGEFSKLRFYNQAYSSSVPMATISAQVPTANVYGRLDFKVNSANVDDTVMSLYEGKVGIGTTSPSRKLSVLGVNNTTNFEVTDAAGGNTFNIYNNTTSSAVAIGTSSGLMSFGFNGIDKVHFKSNGNVGIGTADPNGKLTVALENSNTPAFRLSSPTSGTDFAISSYNDANGTYVSMGVNHLFDVSGNDAVMDTNDKSAAITLDGRNNGRIQFLTNSSGIATPRMSILQDGKIGIGTTSPTNRFHVDYSVSTSSANIAESKSTAAIAYAPLRNGSSYGMYFGNTNYSSGYTQVTDGTNKGSMLINPYGGNVGVGTTSASVQFQVGSEYYGIPYLDIMKVWRTADLQGYKNTYSDGGGISYTWYDGGVVKIDTSIGSHNWDIGEIYLEAGTYFILMQYRPSPDQHGWNVYGTNSNGHTIRLQTNGGYGSFNTLASVYGQAGKDDENSLRFRSGTYTVSSAGKFRIGMGTQPYVTGGYKCWIENAYLMRMS